MKLLQVMAGARYGGAEEFFVRLALAFERANVDQRVAVRGHPFRKKQLSSGGVRTDTFAFRRWLDVRTNFGLRNIIRDWRPDIVLTWMSRASRACPKPKLGRDFVHVGRLGGYYKLKYFRGCDHLIGNTPRVMAGGSFSVTVPALSADVYTQAVEHSGGSANAASVTGFSNGLVHHF